MKPGRTAKDIFSGAAAGIIFLAFLFIIDASIVISVIASVAVYIALSLIFNVPSRVGRIKLGDVEGISADDLIKTIEEGTAKVEEIRSFKKHIKNREVVVKIEAICTVADKIFDNIGKKPKSIKAARKFLSYYLDAAVKILSRYVEISSQELSTEEVDKIMIKVENLLATIKGAFEKQLERLLENDILDLDTEIELLEDTIKAEGL